MEKKELIKKCIVFRMMDIQGDNATEEEKNEWKELDKILKGTREEDCQDEEVKERYFNAEKKERIEYLKEILYTKKYKKRNLTFVGVDLWNLNYDLKQEVRDKLCEEYNEYIKDLSPDEKFDNCFVMPGKIYIGLDLAHKDVDTWLDKIYDIISEPDNLVSCLNNNKGGKRNEKTKITL